MINKNNELPSFVNETNLPKIVDKLTDASNIKIANNKYGNRVQTVVDKIVEKADDITKAIKQEVVNNSYSFKVGTGNVDVSTDVQDGFGEVGVKGVTYQNLLGELEAASTTWQQTNDKYILDLKAGNGQPQIRYRLSYPLKPNTKYTLICEIKEYTTGYPHFCFMTKDNKLVASTTEFSPNTVGIHSAVLTTTSDITAELLRILPRANIDNTYSIGKNIVILEGDHTNNPNLPTYFEGIVGVGDKSKNLFNGKLEKAIIDANGFVSQHPNPVASVDFIKVKPNTTYIISMPTQVNKYIHTYDKNFNVLNEINTQAIFTTPINCEYIKFNTHSNTIIEITEPIQIEEGTVATPYEPYYDGHKIEILSHGKNLYKPNLQTKSANGLTFTLLGDNQLIVNGTCTKITDFRPINGFQTPYLADFVNNILRAGTTLALSNNLGLTNYFSVKRNNQIQYPVNKITKQNGDDIACFVRFEEGQSYNNQQLNIQLEINSKATEFEPYIEDKTQILLDEPLMRLPNGVCDEITKDGKLIRRVGKVVFNGSENWYDNGPWSSGDYQASYTRVTDKLIGKEKLNFLCDRFAVTSQKVDSSNRVINECCFGEVNNQVIYLIIKKEKLTSPDFTGFKQWLSENPTTVYYELAEPIVTELPAPCLRIFKDGHITFNTLVAPESTHVVQLNKSAQIQNAIKESQSLDNRINVLENNYDNLMLSTISRLNDLELNYTLK